MVLACCDHCSGSPTGHRHPRSHELFVPLCACAGTVTPGSSYHMLSCVHRTIAHGPPRPCSPSPAGRYCGTAPGRDMHLPPTGGVSSLTEASRFGFSVHFGLVPSPRPSYLVRHCLSTVPHPHGTRARQGPSVAAQAPSACPVPLCPSTPRHCCCSLAPFLLLL